jgi:hypothetical protein
MKVELSRMDFGTVLIKFHENPSSGSQVVHCGQADMMKLIVAFCNSANMPNYLNVHFLFRSSVVALGNIFVIFFFIPCILLILKFFSPTNAHFIKYIKFAIKTSMHSLLNVLVNLDHPQGAYADPC